MSNGTYSTIDSNDYVQWHSSILLIRLKVVADTVIEEQVIYEGMTPSHV